MTPPALTDVELAELQAKAERATPGPWVARTGPLMGDPQVWQGVGHRTIRLDCNEDAEHIAASNPAVVQRLIAELQAARRTARVLLDDWVTVSAELRRAQLVVQAAEAFVADARETPHGTSHWREYSADAVIARLGPAVDSLRAGRGR